MKRNILFSLFFFFSFLYSSQLKVGDVVFKLYNDYFDYGLSSYLNSKFSHSLIVTSNGIESFTVMYIGDRGEIFEDENLSKDAIRYIVLRPLMNEEQYQVYQKCVDKYFNILSEKVDKGEILFDWNMKNYPNSFVCSTFIFHILKKCLPDYKEYFTISNVDKIHYKNGKPVIFFEKALKLEKFLIVDIKP